MFDKPDQSREKLYTKPRDRINQMYSITYAHTSMSPMFDKAVFRGRLGAPNRWVEGFRLA